MLLIVASFPAYSRCPTCGAANSTSSELYSWVFLAPFVFCSPMEFGNLGRKSIHAMLCGFRNTRSPIFIEALKLPRFFLCGTVLHARCHHDPGRVKAQCDRVSENTALFLLQVPLPVLSISEIQNRVLEEVQNLSFVKDNSATFIERKLSFEKKKTAQSLVSLALPVTVPTASLCLLQIVADCFPYQPLHPNNVSFAC